MKITALEKSFSNFANLVSRWAGSSLIFLMAAFLIVVWIGTEPYFGFSDRWLAVISTFATLVTFLMVFIIQNTQNREGLALQIKLDEIIRALDKAENTIIDLEGLSQEELVEVKSRFSNLAQEARSSEMGNVPGNLRRQRGRKAVSKKRRGSSQRS